MESAFSYYTAMRWNKPLLLCSKSLHHYSPCACILHPFQFIPFFYEEAQSIQQIKTAKYFSPFSPNISIIIKRVQTKRNTLPS